MVYFVCSIVFVDNLDVVQQSITFPNACGKEAISFQLQGSLNILFLLFLIKRKQERKEEFIIKGMSWLTCHAYINC